MKSKIPNNFFNSERIFLVFSFIILLIAAVISFFLPPETRTVIPCPKISIPIINSLCALLTFVTIFKISWRFLQYFILFVESLCTIFTGYELLGIFLYSALLIKLFMNGFFIKRFYFKLIVLLAIWFASILGLIPFGWERVILSYSAICFFCAFYYHVYKKMEADLANYLPPTTIRAKVQLPAYGEKIYLSDYDFSERQKKILLEYLKYGDSYKTIADKFFTSESTIKTEMSKIQKKIGVKNREDLRVLLLQYEIKNSR